jgi:hypothetical protein
MTNYPTTVTASRLPRYDEHTVTYYEGTSEIYVPAETGTGCYSVPVSCGHRHPDPGVAQVCADRKARREARKRNAEITERIKDLPCQYAAHGDRWARDHGELWQKSCTAHYTAAYSPWPLAGSEAEALAQGWTCPWEGVAPACPAPDHGEMIADSGRCGTCGSRV